MKVGSWWRYALGRLLHFFLVYALPVFIYAAVLNGQIEASIRPTLMWSANRTVQGLLQAGDIEPEEAQHTRMKPCWRWSMPTDSINRSLSA